VSCSFFAICVWHWTVSRQWMMCSSLWLFKFHRNTKFFEWWEIQMIFFICPLSATWTLILTITILQFFFTKGLLLLNHLKYMVQVHGIIIQLGLIE
jgi:hypothetical protein